MFETGGCAYVFFVYGMYNQFNVVLNEAGTANAALIRGLEPIAGIETMQERRGTDRLDNLTTGPGKLCQALGIGREQNGVDLGRRPVVAVAAGPGFCLGGNSQNRY